MHIDLNTETPLRCYNDDGRRKKKSQEMLFFEQKVLPYLIPLNRKSWRYLEKRSRVERNPLIYSHRYKDL